MFYTISHNIFKLPITILQIYPFHLHFQFLWVFFCIQTSDCSSTIHGKTIFSLLNCVSSFIIDQLNIVAFLYLWVLCSVPSSMCLFFHPYHTIIFFFLNTDFFYWIFWSFLWKKVPLYIAIIF